MALDAYLPPSFYVFMGFKDGKRPARGTGVFTLVYPLGFEPRLDGVGGRNVIQLHYEYVFYRKYGLFSKSNYILLFFTSILQAFMV